MELQPLPLRRELAISALHAAHYFELSKNYTGPGQVYDAWELVYIDRSELLVVSGEQTFPMAAGELLIHAPGEYHALLGNGISAANVMTVIFPCKSPAMEAFRGRRLRPNTAQRALLKDLLKEIRNSFSNRLDDPLDHRLVRAEDSPIGSEQMIAMYLLELLLSLLRQIHRPQQVDKTLGSVPMLDGMVAYMAQNLSAKMSLELLAREFHVSPSYIKRLFAQYKQMGAMRFFTGLKIEQAKKLLRERETNVSQIAEDLGYDNSSYFCNQFKKHTGMSPTEYRKSVNAISHLVNHHQKQGV